ncbi:hypothetical protein GQ43DRAFT_209051 [Delitschia confertaspora ATCC 74209]|uniref:BZIP domain-containing protein n=1 Tax=Delitschia confertaspora ATCC 74209 TaxID=1513339 RepID=A0A9P4JDY5_9PLEO|nr:hypothetical protein GQ43DRAFT_209051 [Delitschia confertaspora ATCC 74209]
MNNGISEDGSTQDALEIGYRQWPTHIQSPFPDREQIDTLQPDTHSSSYSNPQFPIRRARGRPRVSKERDQSAIEKRRAQVRQAQRTYQKKKEQAASTANQRCDQLLQVLSDVSTEIEGLLQLASTTGALNRNDKLGERLRTLWSTYDASISNPSVIPELRLLQMKNSSRIDVYRNQQPNVPNVEQNIALHTDPPLSRSPPEQNEVHHMHSHQSMNLAERNGAPHLAPPLSSPIAAQEPAPEALEFDLGRIDDTSLIQSFNSVPAMHRLYGGRNIVQIVQERQAQLRNTGNHGT